LIILLILVDHYTSKFHTEKRTDSKRSDEHKIGKLRIKITYVFIAQFYYNVHPMMVSLGSIWGI